MIASLVKKMAERLGMSLFRGKALQLTTRQIENVARIARLYERIKVVPGNIVECGVGKGRSLLYLSFFSLKEGRGRMVWGFDSFAGFPEPSFRDESARKPKKGELSGESVVSIKNLLATAGIPKEWMDSKLRLVEGFFSTTLTRYDRSPIAFLHVDADLYQSHVEVLDCFFPCVAKGGVVLFDDYRDPKWPGATEAVDEFCKKENQELVRDKSGKYYLVKR